MCVIHVNTNKVLAMVDLRAFNKATNPNKTLDISKAEDKSYYIDFSSVRGGDVLKKVKNKITYFLPDEPTCTLFTGHIGCGKSTELLRLKLELEQAGFEVIYFESDKDLEITDVDIADILLVISRRIIEELEAIEIQLHPQGFQKLLQDLGKVLNAEVTGIKVKPPKVAGLELGEIGVKNQKDEFSLSVGIGEITAKTKQDSRLRSQMNMYIAPRKRELINAINEELLEPAIAQLKQRGKQGLVVIVDNLDRIDNLHKELGKTQQEYIFIDQGNELKSLHCHVVYTIPLGLIFANSFGMLRQRFGEDPQVLPMVSVKLRNGNQNDQGMESLRQMILIRAFPELKGTERIDKITEIFESVEVLDHLCRMSGGHVRDLLMLLNGWIMEEMALPLTNNSLEKAIRNSRNAMTRAISDEELQLLNEVKQTKRVRDEEGYTKLIRSRFVFEYQDEEGSWYDINPIIDQDL